MQTSPVIICFILNLGFAQKYNYNEVKENWVLKTLGKKLVF